MLGLFHSVAEEVAKDVNPDLFLNNELMENRMDVYVRITNCDVLSENIRDVRYHMNLPPVLLLLLLLV